MDLGLRDRRVLVIGGSQGIGRAAAALFAGEGARLAIASRSGDKLAAAAEAIGRDAERPARYPVDLTDAPATDRLAHAVAADWGGLDVLVTAVGASIRSDFAALADADWRANYELNLLSTVRAIRAFLPLLRTGRDPAIVVLGSASARMPAEQQIASNVHKAGLIALVKTLALEVAPAGIRVNSVAPGRTLTPLWEERAAAMAASEGCAPEDVVARFSGEIPMRRFGTAEEVAAMVVWLASPRAGYVTAQTVNVDGGIARGLV